MYDKLWLIPFFPLLGFIINGLFGKKIKNEKVIGAIGTLAIFASFIVSCKYFFQLLGDSQKVHEIVLFGAKGTGTWFSVGSLQVDWGFLLDPLSGVMIMIVSGIASLIHLYSIGYMHGEESYYRYFAYLNLFCFSMLMLVLGNNAMVMFIGWEGVGLCSYLLIGYYFEKKSASDAGKKAFVVNRVGDFGFLLGIFALFWELNAHGVGTLNFVRIAEHGHVLGYGSVIVTVVTLCFFLGATGKSAQIPLYTWLPDAMEGPTPVSALIHAATMVTAGVYMIGRMNLLFAMAPSTMMVIAIVGGCTALFAASIGLAQNDIKRVLAYSTVSQLGYMFLAMGVGAFSAGIFHLMTHAFFKACLFLGSGSVIHAMHHALHKVHSHDDAQDMRNMGGLRKSMPITHITFVIATLAIAGIPGLSGFFSKDEILWQAFASTRGHWILWVLGAAAAAMTAFYMFRLVFMTFYGKSRIADGAEPHLHESPLTMTIPLMVLAALALLGGYIGVPAILAGGNHFHHFLEPVFGHSLEAFGIHAKHYGHAVEFGFMGTSILIAIAGITVAYMMYLLRPELPGKLVGNITKLHRAVFNKWYIDELYDFLIVNPTKAIGTFLWKGFDVKGVDGIVNGVGAVVRGISTALRYTQSGYTHNYALTMVAGIVLILGAYILS